MAGGLSVGYFETDDENEKGIRLRTNIVYINRLARVH